MEEEEKRKCFFFFLLFLFVLFGGGGGGGGWVFELLQYSGGRPSATSTLCTNDDCHRLATPVVAACHRRR